MALGTLYVPRQLVHGVPVLTGTAPLFGTRTITLGCRARLLMLAMIIRALKLIRLSSFVDLMTPSSRVLFYVLCIPPPCNVDDRVPALWLR